MPGMGSGSVVGDPLLQPEAQATSRAGEEAARGSLLAFVCAELHQAGFTHAEDTTVLASLEGLLHSRQPLVLGGRAVKLG